MSNLDITGRRSKSGICGTRSNGQAAGFTVQDIQCAMAYIKRVGLGPLLSYAAGEITGSSTGYQPSGPLTGLRASGDTGIVPDLYLHCEIQITWDSGATAKHTIDYDLINQDMTETYDYGWMSSVTNTNVTAAYSQGIDWSTHPTAPSGYSYDLSGAAYSETRSADKLSCTMTYSGYTDGSGTVHYGGVLTITLSTKKTWKDFADQTVLMLGQVTFNDEVLNPIKTYYSNGDSGRPTGNYYLRWLKTIAAQSSSIWYNQMNAVTVSYSRTGGYSYDAQIYHWMRNTKIAYFYKNPWNGQSYIYPPSGLPVQFTRLVAAYGIPFDLSYLSPGIPIETDDTFTSGQNTSLAPYILSQKSLVRPSGDMNVSPVSASYDTTTDSVSFSTPLFTFPKPGNEFDSTTFTFAGPGYLILNWQKPFFVAPATLQPPIYSVAPVSFYGHGSGNLKLYCVTFDHGQNPIFNLAATSWALINKTGGIVDTDLVVSADNKTATLYFTHSGSCRVICKYGDTAVVASGLITIS